MRAYVRVCVCAYVYVCSCVSLNYRWDLETTPDDAFQNMSEIVTKLEKERDWHIRKVRFALRHTSSTLDNYCASRVLTLDSRGI